MIGALSQYLLSSIYQNQSWTKSLNKFKEDIVQRKHSNLKARALNCRKLKEEHKICLENILKEQRYNTWTINKIKMKLIIEFYHLNPISNSTISRCLNKELGYTFGKLDKKAKPSLKEI